MLDSDDCTLSLDNLFFEKPVVHKVNPLHQEVWPWQLEEPPSLSQIPPTQVMQEEAESLACLYSFPLKLSRNPIEKGNDETKDGTNSRYDSLKGSERFRDLCHSPCQCSIDENDSPQDTKRGAISMKYLSVDDGKGPPLQKSLFKAPVPRRLNDSSNSNDLWCSLHTASRPQTFLSPVATATAPPLPFQPPRAIFSQGASPSPFQPASSLPPLLVSSAASVKSSQQAAYVERQDKGTMRALVPSTVPQPLHIQGSDVLRPVSEIPAKFRPIFSEFPFFNYIQSKALDDILYTDKNFVASAPTGSGKTVLFELAIIHLLMETSEPWRGIKAVYMAPIKALCSQCFENWTKKFGPLGLVCKELTGDTEIDDFFEIQDSHIILTTPEKWDSMTRMWKDNWLLQLVRLFLIDEVHVVKDATRGATLEVVVSRMKAVHAYRTVQNQDTGISMRFVAVSATIPNISDIADWLSSEKGPASYLELDESHRPVKLRKVVLGFPCNPNQNEFKFDLYLNYKMANIIQTYSDQKPALVFCSTRKGTQQSAAVLAKDTRFIMSAEHKQRLMKYAQSILDLKLKELVMLGVGYHHAGVDTSDRKLIEKAFSLGDLPVLFTTRTLAMGVNLPAHLVVIKSTMQYVAGSYEEYSEVDLLQMIGRAGRPQFDTSATAVIMTKMQTKDKHMRLMKGMEIIESSLHSHLVEHLNAEIVLQTISDVNMALDWIRSTFLYIRALKNPTHYGFSANVDKCGIESKLQELCLKNLNSLSSINLITMDEDINIKPTDAGKLMARYCVAFDTMVQFSKVSGTENLSDLIELVSKSQEFSDIQLRVTEKRPLNTFNRDKNRTTIRFPMEGKIKSNDMKVNCLIQAQLGSISIQEFGLTQDTAKIFRNGMRITKCLSEYLSQRSKMGFSTLLNSVILAKCFRAKLWENSPYVSKQIDKIGQTLSTAMANAGLTTFSKIEQTNPREIELILNRHPPIGNQIKEFVHHLPKYQVFLEQLPRYSCNIAEIVVKLNLKNRELLVSRRTAPDHHFVTLVIGDSDNNCVFRQKFTDLFLLKCINWSKKIEVGKALKGDEISVNLISSEYVGLDIHQKFNVFYSGGRKFETDNLDNISYESAQGTPQKSAANLHSVDKAAPRSGNATFSIEQGGVSKRQCNHLCKNKDQCRHDCCKTGVTVARKRLASKAQCFSSYLNDLRSRCDTLAPTPVKILKMKMSEDCVGFNMQQFSYNPRKRHNLYSKEGYYHNSPPVMTEQIREGSSQNPNPMDDFDNDDVIFMDLHRTMEKPVQAIVAPRIQQASIGSKNTRPHSTTPLEVSNQSNIRTNETFSQIPSVSFDLGNDWDDWGDFDDEIPIHASETSLIKTQQSTGCSISGYGATEPCLPTDIALRSVSQTTLNTLGPSSFTARQESQTKQNPSTLSTANATELPESMTSRCVAPLTQRFNFFSSMSVPSAAADSSSKEEEEAFLGIFDGIF
ncbi:probable ATP-dependent DNA helicase HFM1 isoform X2 [Syngnathoides biaculeatus]|nr:probable ATP-dependent DNA helicase HFM1 isoform X2 [Syngnathoides biaculeatus]XP_061694342.1 probable ATP-dependent DNA helicase HFM1 isoform X2 [Syngnathoides biaculeatus]XP_061694343.1 probable ATP-dependent DNA helicase HFM1 isoform X2 [Syngnathoides biaculeatus]